MLHSAYVQLSTCYAQFPSHLLSIALPCLRSKHKVECDDKTRFSLKLHHLCVLSILTPPSPRPALPCLRSKHKVECDDKTRFAFSMATDAFQLLPLPGAPAQPSPVMPLAGAPPAAGDVPAPPPFVPPPVSAGQDAVGAAGAAGPTLASRRLAHLPPLGAPPPKKPAKVSQGPPVLPPDALPITREKLQVRVARVWLLVPAWVPASPASLLGAILCGVCRIVLQVQKGFKLPHCNWFARTPLTLLFAGRVCAAGCR